MIENTKINLETITPIYIGNDGNEYSRSEFCIVMIKKEKKVIRLNLDIVGKKIYKYDETLFKKFLKVISDTRSFKNIKTKENQNLKNNYKGLHNFLKENIEPKDKKLYLKILNSYTYRCNLKYGNLKLNESIKDIGLIKEHLKTNNELYISGSSIKGAIRNSLLYSILNLNNVENYKIRKTIEFKNKKLNDTMKYIHFTDTLNSIKEGSIYGVESIGTKRRNTFSFFETIDKNNTLEFEYYNTFDSSIHKKSDLNNLDLDIKSIFKSIYTFSNDLIDNEIKFIDEEISFNHNYLNIDSEKLYKYYEDLKNQNNIKSPLLRLGQGSGALAMSQLLNIKNSREEYEFNNFREKNRIGKYYSDDLPYPKTRKLIVNTLKPLGWVKLSE